MVPEIWAPFVLEKKCDLSNMFSIIPVICVKMLAEYEYCLILLILK